MEVLLYVLIPMALAGLVNYGLTLIVPKEALLQAKEAEREKYGKPQRKSREESDIVDRHDNRETSRPSGIVAREQARKSERASTVAVAAAAGATATAATIAAAEEEVFGLPADFDMDEFRSARD